MKKKRILFFVLIILLLIITTSGFAAPNINSISGTVDHKSQITISGSEFGAKSPAAPLKWDDCENKTANSDSAVTSAYDQVWPQCHYDLGNWNMRYRSIPFTPTANVGSVSGPHANSTKFLSGGHKDTRVSDGENWGRNVLVLIDSGQSNTRWFVNFYHRVTMPLPGSTDSHKFMRWQSGGTFLEGSTSYIQWKGYNSLTVPEENGEQCALGLADDWDNTRAHTTGNGMPNPNKGWVHVEAKIINESGDNAYFRIGSHEDYAIEFDDTTDIWNWGLRSLAIGGFYRNRISDGSDYYHDDAWRYYDDIYVDTTLSRVMAGNASTYSDCTILEPQIPSAWSASSITATVNQGALSAGTNYLYVFDANNNHNSAGYPVTIGGSAGGGDDGGDDDEPLSAPTAPTLRVVE